MLIDAILSVVGFVAIVLRNRNVGLRIHRIILLIIPIVNTIYILYLFLAPTKMQAKED